MKILSGIPTEIRASRDLEVFWVNAKKEMGALPSFGLPCLNLLLLEPFISCLAATLTLATTGH